MGRLEHDAKFEQACLRLSSVAPQETLAAVSNINGLIVDHLVRENPATSARGGLDYDLLRRLWKQHERTDPID